MQGRATLNAGLARTISRQVAEIRRLFEEQRFVEIFVPHLTRNYATPFRSTFTVTAPESNFVGALRVSSGIFLANSVSELKRVYTISTSFRSAPTAGSKLVEFQLVEAWSAGNLDDVRRLVEDLLRRQVNALLSGPNSISAERRRELESIELPLRSVTYDEAVGRARLNFGQRPSSEVAKQVVDAYGSKPVFVTDIPENIDPTFPDIRQDGDQRHRAFVLMTPAGNAVVGGELETDYDVLSGQIDRSTYLAELIRLGGSREQFEPYLRTISSLESPHFKLLVGFERLTQFLLGTDRIEDAVFLPVYGQLWEANRMNTDSGGGEVSQQAQREAALAAARRIIIIIIIDDT